MMAYSQARCAKCGMFFYHLQMAQCDVAGQRMELAVCRECAKKYALPPEPPQTLAEASQAFHDASVEFFWQFAKALRLTELVDAMAAGLRRLTERLGK